MKRILVILICFYEFCSCCKENGFDECEINEECCSGYCDVAPGEENGTCKIEPGKEVKCIFDWLECQNKQQCCSGKCDKPNGFKYGICVEEPKEKFGGAKKCIFDWLDCIENDQCCSGKCDIPDGHRSGLCVAEPNSDRPETCEDDLYQGCVEDEQCCSKKCEKQKGKDIRSCRPSHQCEPLFSGKLNIVCFLFNGSLTKCREPLPNNSRATFTCKSPIYTKVEEPGYLNITCKNGEWNFPLNDDFCQAECGKISSNVYQPTVANGRKAEYGEFPWHAGIYQFNSTSGSFDHICGGSLISHQTVISAAHCFTEIIHRDKRIKNTSIFKVSLGNNHRTFNSSKDDLTQIFDLEKIEIPEQYDGHRFLYTYDIAVLKLKTKVEYNSAVRPVCLDIPSSNNGREPLRHGEVGKVVGWGLTGDGSFSETLMLAEMPYVSKSKCRKEIDIKLFQYVNEDKMCAGDRTKNVTVCSGDSGGGLVFYNPANKVYILRGIVSLGPKGCKGTEYALFTRLSAHEKFLRKFLST